MGDQSDRADFVSFFVFLTDLAGKKHAGSRAENLDLATDSDEEYETDNNENLTTLNRKDWKRKGNNNQQLKQILRCNLGYGKY
jgi:hypothetical protein